MTFKAAIPKPDTSASIPELSIKLEDSEVLHVLPEIPGEVVRDFWLIRDMFTFENVGVSNAVNNLKYLTCADCEIGPIGYHDMSKKDEYFVACQRVTSSQS